MARAIGIAIPILLGGCRAPEPEPPLFPSPIATAQSRVALEGFTPDDVDGPLSMRLSDLPRRAIPPPGGDDTVMDGLGAPLTGGIIGPAGEALDARLKEFPASTVEQLGVAVLPLDELYGTTFRQGLCEDPRLRFEFEEGGVEYEADLVLPAQFSFANEVTPALADVPDDCVDALLAAKGDVALALEEGCSEDDERMFFPEGSECRDCLEDQSGDFDECVDEDECFDEAPLMSWVQEGDEEVWYDMAEARIWICAPDWILYTVLLGNFAPDGTMPRAFDHANWAYMCVPYWDPLTDSLQFTCISGIDGPARGDALGLGVTGRVRSIHEKGSRELLHRDRTFYTPRIVMEDGFELRWFWAWTPGVGMVSMPSFEPDTNGNGKYDIEDENFGFGYDSWGLDPFALRPDGSDPDELDHTFARDWLAVATLKPATTMDGVPIDTYNRNRCTQWDGPDESGAHWCREQGEPIHGWDNDAGSVWFDSSFTAIYQMPMATIGSTGLPDPLVPGGFVPLVAGSDLLANPDWDDCRWPHRFVPDWMPYEDTPGGFGGTASLWGHTYRFGKDPDLDLRVVLNTNVARHFCPEAL
jgi:hypothetical protein